MAIAAEGKFSLVSKGTGRALRGRAGARGQQRHTCVLTGIVSEVRRDRANGQPCDVKIPPVCAVLGQTPTRPRTHLQTRRENQCRHACPRVRRDTCGGTPGAGERRVRLSPVPALTAE